MKSVLIDILLALALLSVWLGCAGFVRLTKAMDRLHCAAFVNVGAGINLTLAVMVQDGLTSRSWKTLALLVFTMLVGAATTHAVGRAIYLRDGEDQ